MDNGILKLNLQDIAKGAITAVVAAVVFTLGGALSAPGFDLFSADWSGILSTALNAGVASFVGYIGKALMSTNDGKVFGKIG